jgi:hypothetical protein
MCKSGGGGVLLQPPVPCQLQSLGDGLVGVMLRGVVVLVLILCSVCSSKFFFFRLDFTRSHLHQALRCGSKLKQPVTHTIITIIITR